MSTPAIRRRAVACPVAVTTLLALAGVPALGNPFGGGLRGSATYAANLGTSR